MANTNFVDFQLQKSKIRLWLNMKKGELDDPRGLARDVSGVGKAGNGEYQVDVKPSADRDYIMTLVKQSYAKHSKQ